MIRNFRRSKYERVKKQRRPVHKPGHAIKPETVYNRKKDKQNLIRDILNSGDNS